MIDEARKRTGAPENAGVIFTEWTTLAIPVMDNSSRATLDWLASRTTFSLKKITPRLSIGYGYKAAYCKALNLLVIRRPVVDSVEAIGL